MKQNSQNSEETDPKCPCLGAKYSFITQLLMFMSEEAAEIQKSAFAHSLAP